MPMNDEERKTKLVEELLETESSYVGSMSVFVSLFEDPLRESITTGVPIIPAETIDKIFSNAKNLLTLNKTFLDQLQERVNTPDFKKDLRFGDVFLKLCPFLKLYSVYSSNYDTANALFQKLMKENTVFAQFVTEAEELPETKGLKFQSFLIMPVQRVPRYKMLFQDILKHTPLQHSDRAALEESLTKTSEIALHLNETMKQEDRRAKLQEIRASLQGYTRELIQPGRELIYEGELLKICRKTNKPRYFILFSDMILYASYLGAGLLFFRDEFSLESIRVNTFKMSDNRENSHDYAFSISSPSKSFVVIAPDLETQEKWMQIIQQTANIAKERKKTLKIGHNKEENSSDSFSSSGDLISSSSCCSSSHSSVYLSSSDSLHQKSLPGEHVAPVWIQDSDAKVCMDCNTPFSLLRRRHHCRHCGRVLCADCSPKRDLPGKGELVRICDTCLENINSIMENNHGSDSEDEKDFDFTPASPPPLPPSPSPSPSISSVPSSISSTPSPLSTSPPSSLPQQGPRSKALPPIPPPSRSNSNVINSNNSVPASRTKSQPPLAPPRRLSKDQGVTTPPSGGPPVPPRHSSSPSLNQQKTNSLASVMTATPVPYKPLPNPKPMASPPQQPSSSSSNNTPVVPSRPAKIAPESGGQRQSSVRELTAGLETKLPPPKPPRK
eukprot:Lithocolla_globosa_v1_NODE_1510_length_2521_cov_10.159773.p1 type:complete len:669 gc:universal NODE_1510_length_2521_cov_10.159773:510-2516(+)